MARADITIRRGGGADARAAADLYLRARAAAATTGAIPPGVHDEDDVRNHFATHVVTDCELWVAEETPHALAGILVLDGEAVDHLYVDPERTGHGIGSALLDVAKRERSHGLELWTFQTNTGAQRFYERHGFAVADRTDGRDNEERAPDVLYVWGAPG
jgi:GNAT superfamily N-acetyltransferase